MSVCALSASQRVPYCGQPASALVRVADGEELAVAATDITVTGGFPATGDNEVSCPCMPVCGDRVCGDDGCDGTCGDCADDARCDAAGACVALAPGTCFEGSELRAKRRPAAADLVTTEVMPDPAAVSDSTGEWFEVYVRADVDPNGLTAGRDPLDPDSALSEGDCVGFAGPGCLVFARGRDPEANRPRVAGRGQPELRALGPAHRRHQPEAQETAVADDDGARHGPVELDLRVPEASCREPGAGGEVLRPGTARLEGLTLHADVPDARGHVCVSDREYERGSGASLLGDPTRAVFAPGSEGGIVGPSPAGGARERHGGYAPPPASGRRVHAVLRLHPGLAGRDQCDRGGAVRRFQREPGESPPHIVRAQRACSRDLDHHAPNPAVDLRVTDGGQRHDPDALAGGGAARARAPDQEPLAVRGPLRDGVREARCRGVADPRNERNDRR